eukprot:6214274-Pleurochrysis_carterae.AAC.3
MHEGDACTKEMHARRRCMHEGDACTKEMHARRRCTHRTGARTGSTGTSMNAPEMLMAVKVWLDLIPSASSWQPQTPKALSAFAHESGILYKDSAVRGEDAGLRR